MAVNHIYIESQSRYLIILLTEPIDSSVSLVARPYNNPSLRETNVGVLDMMVIHGKPWQ